MATSLSRSYSYHVMARHFLGLAFQASKELIAGGNPSSISFPPETKDWESQYSEAVRWADHSVGIAILFNLLHGTELVLKGFLVERGWEPRSTHTLSNLLNEFQARYPEGENVRASIEALFSSFNSVGQPFQEFLASNTLDLDNWYIFLKYPETTSKKQIDHFPLKFNGAGGIQFWEKVNEHSTLVNRQKLQLCQQLGMN